MTKDVQSNYGNWQYTAGVGTDPREYRKFNMIKQQKDYDPSGEYVQTWVDELKGRPPGDHGIFMPWEVSPVPKGYPAPLVIEPEWSKFSRKGSQQQGPHSSQKSRGKKGNNGSFTPRTSDWKIVITRKGDPKADDPKGQ